MVSAGPLEILYVRSLFRPADFGGNRYPWEVTRRLAARGHNVRVVTPRLGGPLPGRTRATFVHYPVSRRTPLETFITNALFSRLAIERTLREHAADIAVLSSYEVAYGFLGVVRKRRPSSVFIYHSRFRSDAVERLERSSGLVGTAGAILGRFVEHVERTIFRSVDTLVAVSPYSRSEIEGRLGRPDTRVRVIPTGVDTRYFRPGDRGAARRALGLHDDDLVLLTVGRLVPVKRYDRALRTFSILRRAAPTAVLLIVGGGSEESRLRALADELGVHGSVRFEGFRDGDALRVRYQAADAQLCTSDFENWSLSLLEGLSSGLPVFGVPRGSVPDLLQLVDDGLVADSAEPDRLAELVARYFATPDRLRAVGSQARRVAEAEFDWEKVVDRLEVCFRDTLSR